MATGPGVPRKTTHDISSSAASCCPKAKAIYPFSTLMLFLCEAALSSHEYVSQLNATCHRDA